jgi:hypothetical protein
MVIAVDVADIGADPGVVIEATPRLGDSDAALSRWVRVALVSKI